MSVGSKLVRGLQRAEDIVLGVLLLLMAFIPAVELVARRWFRTGIPGSTDYLRHLTLWVGFLGAMVATRHRRHLGLAAPLERLPERVRRAFGLCGAFTASLVCWGLAWASLQVVIADAPSLPASFAEHLPRLIADWLDSLGLFGSGGGAAVAGWMPAWVAESVMPLGFTVMAVRFVLHASRGWGTRLLLALGLPLAILLPIGMPVLPQQAVFPSLALLVVTAFMGAPIFTLLGGAALVLFWAGGVTVASIPAETYRIVASPIFPTIPIFTLVGFILSESKASERLVRVFQAWFGWIPGGSAVAVTLLCAFFTTFTGASGITILALGGLLLPVLLRSGFHEGFSIGLLTATGSIGLLFPPSLVVILYGVVAHVPIIDLFKGGLVPGALLVLPVCVLCAANGLRSHAARVPFRPREALAALWAAKWDVLMPVVALVGIFGGFCTLVEAAALTVLYALLVEFVIHRDLKPRGLAAVLLKCAVLVGGVLIILGVAMGLTSYLVDAEIPMRGAAWAEAHIHSRWVFLLGLNAALFVVGCLMDIYSALAVVVPLILPMAAVFGIDPVHLGIIFLANLQLGYLTPPVGMNLFLAAFRFDKPLAEVVRHALPFLLILLVVVLLVTYVPWLTVGVLAAWK